MLVIALSASLIVSAAGFALSAVTSPENIILTLTGEPGEMAVTWWDSAGVPPTVAYGISGGGLTSTAAAKAEASRGSFTVYSAVMTGLAPGGTYSYMIPGMAAPVDFAAPDTHSGGFSFMYLGDVQAGSEENMAAWSDLVINADSRNPGLSFGVIGGDLVDTWNHTAEWQSFFSLAQRLFSKIPLMPVPGNHEANGAGSGKPEFYTDFFTLPRNGPPGFEEEFYCFEYGDALFLMLNSSVFLDEQLRSGAMSTDDFLRIEHWIREVAAGSDKTWKIAVMHHPAYQVVSDRAGQGILQNWVPIFEAAKFDLVFNGHQHVYSRTHPMYEGNISGPSDGITYIMGNSGPKHYRAQNHSYFQVMLEDVGTYQIVDVTASALSVKTYNENGTMLDSFTAALKDRSEAPSLSEARLQNTLEKILRRIDGADISGAHSFAVAQGGGSPEPANAAFSTAIDTAAPMVGVQMGVEITFESNGALFGAQASLKLDKSMFSIDAVTAGHRWMWDISEDSGFNYITLAYLDSWGTPMGGPIPAASLTLTPLRVGAAGIAVENAKATNSAAALISVAANGAGPFTVAPFSASAGSFVCTFAWDTDAIWSTRIINADGKEGDAIPAGSLVTVTAGRPESDQTAVIFDGITVRTAGGAEIGVTELLTIDDPSIGRARQGTYTFTMPGEDVTIEIVAEAELVIQHRLRGSGVSSHVRTFTLNELKQMHQERHGGAVYYYTAFDNLPTAVLGKMDEYVELMEILGDAGLPFDYGDVLWFASSDSPSGTLGYDISWERIFGSGERYYFPNISPNDDISSVDGMEEIQPALGIRSFSTRIGLIDGSIEDQLTDMARIYRFAFGQTMDNFYLGMGNRDYRTAMDTRFGVQVITIESDTPWAPVQGVPEAPPAPTARDITDTSVTLNTIPGAEYRRGADGAWQGSPAFYGLEPGTAYVFYARIMASGGIPESQPSPPANITTLLEAISGTASISGESRIGRTLTVHPEIPGNSGPLRYQWQADGENAGVDSDTYTLTGADAGKVITCIVTRPGAQGSIAATFDDGRAVPFDIVAVNINANPSHGDIPAEVSQSYGRAGDTVTLTYALGDAGGTPVNTLTFTGATGGLNNLAAAGESTQQYYTVTPGDAADGTITITATFLHSMLAQRTLSFPAGSQARIFGDAPFTMAASVSAGDGMIAYSSSNTGVAAVDGGGYVTIYNAGSAVITATIADDGEYASATASYTLEVSRASQAAPAGLGKTDETAAGANNGSITGVNGAMEYRRQGETIYTAASGAAITWLAPGTYLVRYAGTQNHFPSDDTAVTVGAFVQQQTTFTVSFYNGTTLLDVRTVTSPATTLGALPSNPTSGSLVFGGWFTGQNGAGSQFTASTAVTSNISVYAHFTAPPTTYTVTFYNGSSVHATRTVTTPATTIGSMPANPTSGNLVFGGWFTGQNGAGVQFSATNAITSNVSVYAHFTTPASSFTVSFYNGNTLHATRTVTNPSTTVSALPTNPTSGNLVFGGWYTGQNGTGSQFTATTTVTSSISVYAHFSASSSYTVSFYNGNTLHGTRIVTPPSTTISALPSNPTSGNLVFAGWFTAQNGGGAQFTATTAVSSSISVYAHWTSGNNNNNSGTGNSASSQQPGTQNPSTVQVPTIQTPLSEFPSLAGLPTVSAAAVSAGVQATQSATAAVAAAAGIAAESSGASIIAVAPAVTVSVGASNTVAALTFPAGVDVAQITTMAVLNEGDGTLTPVPTRLGSDGRVRVLIRGEATLVPLYVSAGFTDTAGHVEHVRNEINRAASLMIVNGRGSGIFDPDANVTTQEAATMFLRSIGVPVDYTNAINTGAARGLLSSGTDGARPMSRFAAAEMIVGAMRAVGLDSAMTAAEAAAVLSQFTDVANLSDGEKIAMAICFRLSIFRGAGDGLLNPYDTLQRSQMASLAVRLQDVLLDTR